MILRCMAALMLLAASFARGQEDTGKEVVGNVVVRVFHVTDGDPKAAGDKAKPLAQAAVDKLQKEEHLKFAHYSGIGVDTKPLYRSYENWAQPLGGSDEVMVRFEAQSKPTGGSARLGLELWLSRKKVLKTDAEVSAEKPLYVLGPAWRGGRLLISVALAPKPKGGS
ncbi:hypothetical protein [Luteolibacter sp. LG18]|uniref:hypothetical protein n=1 Tax=Luteolibacter sp. LG18 TaxID=2819286 RepID=UPI002B314057|nr:hypothetical protein llg_38300 [Luteolibacter sp. LG18]